MPSRTAMRAARDEMAGLLAIELPNLTLGLGAENYWDDVLAERLRQGDVPGYGGGRAFLYEVDPLVMPPGLDAVLFQARLAGFLPVMAHPERYAQIQDSPTAAADLARQSGLLVDLAALSGRHGRVESKTARKLVEEGIAHAVASDMHDPADERSIAEGMNWIGKHLPAETLDRLLGENPRRMLKGELP